MNTHVIILCQGKQSRLPELPVAKQLLPLPSCNGEPILHRTIRQVYEALNLGAKSIGDAGWRDAATWRRDMVTVVCSLPMSEDLTRFGVKVQESPGVYYHPNTQTLRDPGNSSLKGIKRFLDLPREAMPVGGPWDRTVVLLGDVVYSWACLRAILDIRATIPTFVGTSNLSRSTGELWGIAWLSTIDGLMRKDLEIALLDHPPFDDTYQPGQLRRWLWTLDKRLTQPDGARPWYRAIDDYTMDVDLPEHIPLLGRASELAAVDDAKEGMAW